MLNNNIKKDINRYNFLLEDNKYILLGSIGLLIIGTVYLFDNINNEKIDTNKKELLIKENQEISKQIKESKDKCYQILINTMYDFKDKYKDDNLKRNDFNLFMKEMWNRDYFIMLEQLEEYTNQFHRYKEWENIFCNI